MDYLKIVKNMVSAKRYDHILHVIDEAIVLAKIYNCDVESARIAATLHDSTKYFDDDLQKNMIIKEYGIDFLNTLVPQVYHSFTGMIYARDTLNILNEDILHAIENHTLGRENMSTLEKIIFIADFTEKSRTFEESNIARELSYKSLDKAIVYILTEVINWINN